MGWILDIVSADWSYALLLGGAALFLVGMVLAFVFPIFGGATASNDEIPSMGVMVGSRLALAPLVLFAVVWAGRAAIWFVRLLVCPC